MENCPKCKSPEVESNSPRTTYECGSSDYDQRYGTFVQSKACLTKLYLDEDSTSLSGYYIPDEDEFHLGFRYEVKIKHGTTWFKQELESVNLTNNEHGEYDNENPFGTYQTGSKLRVKCLDEDNIKELGFKEGNDYISMARADEYRTFNIMI